MVQSKFESNFTGPADGALVSARQRFHRAPTGRQARLIPVAPSAMSASARGAAEEERGAAVAAASARPGHATSRTVGGSWLTSELMTILEDGFAQMKPSRKMRASEPEAAQGEDARPHVVTRLSETPILVPPLALPKARVTSRPPGTQPAGGCVKGSVKGSAKGSTKARSAIASVRGSERSAVGEDDDVLVQVLREHMRPASQSTLRSALSIQSHTERGSVIKGPATEKSAKSERESKLGAGAEPSAANAREARQPAENQNLPSHRSLGGIREVPDERVRPGGAAVTEAKLNLTVKALQRRPRQGQEQPQQLVRPVHPIMRRRHHNKIKDDLNRSLRIPVDTYALRRVQQQAVPPRIVH
jgi:hypothetical protein